MPKNQFNVILSGVGGQGIISLLQILAKAAFLEGNEVRSSEVHGLSQRGGSVVAHLRWGKEIYSPLISHGRADLMLGLEICEALRTAFYAHQKTIFLVNKKLIPFQNSWSEKKILENLNKLENLFLVEASKICQEKLGSEVTAGVYLLGLAINKKSIPLKPNSILKAIKVVIPEKYRSLNFKAFKVGLD